MLGEHGVYATIAVKDCAVSKPFYSDVLGLKVISEMPGMLMYQSGKDTLFVYESNYAGTNKATAATWDVQGIEAVVADLKTKGVNFEEYDMPDTRVENSIHISEGMKVAWCKDPDGNILALVEAKG